MKVIFIIHSCGMGGATISLLKLINGLQNSGIEPLILYPKGDEKEKDFKNVVSCKCISVPITCSVLSKNDTRIKKLISILFLMRRKVISFFSILKIIKNEKPDIIHTNTGVVHEGALVANFLGIKHVWHIREYQDKDFNWNIFPTKHLFEKLLKKSIVICITKDLQKYFNLEMQEKSYVIYNPIFEKKELMSPNFLNNKFLIANRISPEKGIEEMLEAFGIFSKTFPDYELDIAGFGEEDYITQLKKYIINKNIKNVNLLGYRNDILQLIIASKALIVGSYNEGFGRMTAEANMLGVPVIGRNSAGTKEIIEQTYGGFLCNNVEEFVQKMEYIAMKNSDELKSFMIKPAEKAIELFESKNHIEHLLKLYNSLI